MRFIEDHYISFRDQFAKPALFYHHISEKQMVVNHDDIRIHRFFTRFHDKTLFIQRAVAAQTVVISAGDQRPGLRVFRHADAGADVPIKGLI
ncbi:hypothetical protein SDC9_196746 [bioreactor metagenome]|uniref:Uncharacterized protein n=1 Tax=bioreactor metagenome TaxID=1076179 RepID=A0A645IPG3_9ZZZZ